jgi:hypothetical protein
VVAYTQQAFPHPVSRRACVEAFPTYAREYVRQCLTLCVEQGRLIRVTHGWYTMPEARAGAAPVA